MENLKSGDTEGMAYGTVTGVTVTASGEREEEEDSDTDSDSGAEDDIQDRTKFVDSHRPRDESPNSKKVR